MTRQLDRFTALLVAAVLTGSCHARPISQGGHAPAGSLTDAVLIAKYMYDPDSVAALITEPATVRELAELIADNPHRVEHACGYHWLIAFREATGRVRTFAHNQDCEQYQRNNRRVHSVLRRHFDHISQRPSHFLFNVSVPAEITPEDIMAKIDAGPGKVFFLNGIEERLPRLRLEVTSISAIPDDRTEWDRAKDANLQVAMKRMADVVSEVRRVHADIHHSKFRNRASSFGGGEIEHRVETTVYFPFGAVISAPVSGDVRVLERTHPPRYTIQVVGTDRSSVRMKRTLEERLGVRIEVAPYPEEPTETSVGDSSRPAAF